MVTQLVLELWEALAIDISAAAMGLVIFFAWVFPRLRRLAYWRFIEGWMVFFAASGVIAFVLEVGVVGIGAAAALVSFVLAMAVALVAAPVIFKAASRASTRRNTSPKNG